MNYAQAFKMSFGAITQYKNSLIDVFNKRKSENPDDPQKELLDTIAYVAFAESYMSRTNKILERFGKEVPAGIIAIIQDIDMTEEGHPTPDINAEFDIDRYLVDIYGEPMSDEEFKKWHSMLWDALWNDDNKRFAGLSVRQMWDELVTKDHFPKEKFKSELKRRGLSLGMEQPKPAPKSEPKKEEPRPSPNDNLPNYNDTTFDYHPSMLVQFKTWIAERGWKINKYSSQTGQLEILGTNYMTNQPYAPVVVNPNDVIKTAVRNSPAGMFYELFVSARVAAN